jgi:hypothetical protein
MFKKNHRHFQLPLTCNGNELPPKLHIHVVPNIYPGVSLNLPSFEYIVSTFLGYICPALVVNFLVPIAEYELLYLSVLPFPGKVLLFWAGDPALVSIFLTVRR